MPVIFRNFKTKSWISEYFWKMMVNENVQGRIVYNGDGCSTIATFIKCLLSEVSNESFFATLKYLCNFEYEWVNGIEMQLFWLIRTLYNIISTGCNEYE